MRAFLKNVLVAAVAITAAATFSMPAASAQEIFGCGASAEVNVVTQPSARIVTSTTFTTLYTGKFARVAATLSDCTLLTFSAETACRGAGADDYCYVRAFINNQEMAPRTGGTRIFDSETQTPAMRTVTFALKGGLLVGENTFRLQVRVGKPGTSFVIDDWMIEVRNVS